MTFRLFTGAWIETNRKTIMKTLTPGDKLNCYVIDRNGQQSNLAIQILVVAIKQSVYADGLYTSILCIVDERTGKLIEDHQGEEMTPFVHALCCDD